MKIDLKLPDKIFGLDSALLMFFLPPLGMIFLFLISLKFILLPKFDEIGLVKNEINKVNASTSKLNEQIGYVGSIDQEELQKNTEYLDNAVLKDKKSYLLVEIIREVANRFDFQIESFSLTPGEIKDDSSKVASLKNMIKMPVNLLMSGPKDKSLDLILALEKTLPILFIDKYETSISQGSVELDLTVSSYYIPEGKDVDTNNVSLNDLILSDEESKLVEKISSFTKIEENKQKTETLEYQKYDRKNPFNL